MKKLKKSKSKKLKKTKKARKTKKIRKVKKPKKVLRKKTVTKRRRTKKSLKLKKPKKVTKKKTTKPIKAKKKIIPKRPPAPPKPTRIEEAPPPVPAAEKVPYTQENAILCICTKCPTQAESICAGTKVREMEEMMAKGMPEGMMPPPADLPGLYCSTGAATCKDLDLTKMCICTGCPVWDKCNLSDGQPMGYFCRDGKAT
jgi:hypothetical protein